MKLELSNLSCGYGPRSVVRDVSVSVEQGEVLCLLGPNGSGKTTLFKTILGLLKPLRGSIFLDGQDITVWSRRKIAKAMGYIPQAHNAPFPYAVLDVVLMGRTSHLGAFASPSRADVGVALDAIATLGISHLRDRAYTEISGGERQLVLIARALAKQPQILVMDEPTSNLDFGNQLLVLSHVQQMARRGLTIVMASHFPDHAFLYASKVLLVNRGVAAGIGPPMEVVTEESIRDLYGVDVKLLSAFVDGSEVRVCVPLRCHKTDTARSVPHAMIPIPEPDQVTVR